MMALIGVKWLRFKDSLWPTCWVNVLGTVVYAFRLLGF